jgi:hypothetical protein
MTYYPEIAEATASQNFAEIAQEQMDMALQQITEGLTQIENIDFQAPNANVATSFNGAEMSAWFGEQVAAFE